MHTGAGAGARETRHGTLVTQKKSLGGAGRCRDGRIVGWSEKPKSWKSKNVQADYLPRHSPDVRTVFEIKIRPLVFCEIGQMRFTEKGINFKKPRRRHFTEKSPNFMKPSQI